jgi:hypothetical protein
MFCKNKTIKPANHTESMTLRLSINKISFLMTILMVLMMMDTTMMIICVALGMLTHIASLGLKNSKNTSTGALFIQSFLTFQS